MEEDYKLGLINRSNDDEPPLETAGHAVTAAGSNTAIAATTTGSLLQHDSFVAASVVDVAPPAKKRKRVMFAPGTAEEVET